MSSPLMLPSSETNPITSRKPELALLTVIPCCCTICGSDGVASESLFCTCTCAMSGSVPFAKVSVIEAMPFDSLVADM